MKVIDLEGAALDWAVAKCEGHDMEYFQVVDAYLPSTDWAQGGPIIEREKISVIPIDEGSEWYAEQWWAEENYSTGPTPLVAAMRCYVASQMGDEIELPEELK